MKALKVIPVLRIFDEKKRWSFILTGSVSK